MKQTITTKSIKIKTIDQNWHLLDAKGKVLGRFASDIALLLTGKHKSNYVDYLDCGDNVVVINAAKIKITGNKLNNKTYSRYSGYQGGLKLTPMKTYMRQDPRIIIKHAVSGMLPKNKLRKQRLIRLYIYSDEIHPFNDKFK